MNGSDFDLVVHHLRFTLEARTLVHLGPQAGGQLRGALWAALQPFACSDPSVQGQPEHSQHCPMCRLMALETAQGARGVNPPRPFAIQPPLLPRVEQDRLYQAGEQFVVGVSLFGDAAALFPYICQAMYRTGEIGVGYGRGRFFLRRVQAVNPLTGDAPDVLEDGRTLHTPGLPVTGEQVSRVAATLATDGLRLRFLTPTQITHSKGRMADRPYFDKLVARLLERCQSLEQHYSEAATPQPVWRERHLRLTELARSVQLVEDNTRWVQARSGSRRTGDSNTVSGFVGEVRYVGDLAPFREWLLWGQSLHVGKNTVKGNGWYVIC